MFYTAATLNSKMVTFNHIFNNTSDCVVFVLMVKTVTSVHHDKSLTPGATGEEVVRRTLDVLLRKCLITPREDRFLLRLAHVVSDYGVRNASDSMSTGGIWKV